MLTDKDLRQMAVDNLVPAAMTRDEHNAFYIYWDIWQHLKQWFLESEDPSTDKFEYNP